MADSTDPTGGNELDYSYAPVGLFVLTFWTSALLIGLVGFGVTILTAKGYGPIIVTEDKGIADGMVMAGIIFVLALIMGLLVRSMILKRKNIDALWKVAFGVIPPAMVVLTIAAITVNH